MILFTPSRLSFFWLLAYLTTVSTVAMIVERSEPAAAQISPRLVNLAVSDVRYVRSTRSDSAILVVKTASASSIAVDYGLSTGKCPESYTASIRSDNLKRHEVPLDGLNPESFYSSVVCYRVRDADTDEVLAESSFRTARRSGESFSFGVVGDVMPSEPWRTTSSEGWRRISGQMHREDLDLALITGDMVNNHWFEPQAAGVEEKYNGFFQEAMNFTGSAALYAAVGNHEQVYAPVCRSSFEWEFTLPRNDRAGEFGEHYYSFDGGDTHFVALSTEIPGQEGLIIGDQLAWLERDLAACNKTWIVVFFHRPLFYPPGIASQMLAYEPWFNPADTVGLANRQYLHDLFRRAGVDLVFNGHAHLLYHHIEDGVSYVIAGSGGSDILDYSEPAMGSGDMFFYEGHGHIRVDESLNTLALSIIDADGGSREHFTLNVDGFYGVSLDSGEAPVVSDVSPSGIVSGTSVSVGASFKDPPPSDGIDTSSVAVSVNGEAASGCTVSESNVSCSVEGLAAGEYFIEVAASDKAGNRSQGNGAFTVVPESRSDNAALAMLIRGAYLFLFYTRMALQFI